MRQDMHRLNAIRSLGITGQRKLFSRGVVRDVDALPTRQSMRSSFPHYSYPRVMKLSPALRCLRRQVNRPWDDVYSELRNRFDARSTRQAALLSVLLKYVERKVRVGDDGKPWGPGLLSPCRVYGLYVHPVSKLLMDARGDEFAAKNRAKARHGRAAAKAAECVPVSSTLQLRLIDKLWYWVELSEVTPPKYHTASAINSKFTGEELVPERLVMDYSSICRDVLTGQEFRGAPSPWSSRELRELYGDGNIYAKRKWQASHRDIERHVAHH